MGLLKKSEDWSNEISILQRKEPEKRTCLLSSANNAALEFQSSHLLVLLVHLKELL